MLLALSLGCALNVSARARVDVPANAGGKKNGGGNNKITAACLTSSSNSSLDINNVRAMVLNGGDMWWNLSDPRYEVPRVDDPNLPKKHSLFAGAVWIGGKDPQNNLYLAAQTYRQGSPADVGYWPGPLDNTGNVAKEDCAIWNYHAKIDKAVVDKFRDDFGKGFYADRDETKLPKAIKDWPAKKNPFIKNTDMNHDLAPFINVGGPADEYNPFDGDYPDFRGDQGIWWVMNDAGNVKVPQSSTIGLELQVLAFAFQTNNLINNMTFYKQKLINKGQNQLNNTYLGQWVDPDLGFYNDDFVGCDVGRGLGICYNGDNDDEGANGYGLNPPAIGVDFFQGPAADPNDGIDNDRDGTIDEADEKIIMSSFIYYNNDNNPTNGNPQRASDFYNYLQAIWRDGKQITFGGDGTNQSAQPYKFMFSDDTDPKGLGFSNPRKPDFEWSENKTQATGQSSNTPADRRFLQSAGPFTLKQGAVNELTIGVVWARANSGGAKGSLGLLKNADDIAQSLFDNDFKLPQGPNAPKLEIAELDQQLILTLIPQTFLTSNDDKVTTETYFEKNQTLETNGAKDAFYRFEGYKVYQLKDPTVTSSELSNPDRARLVAQADLKNGVTEIVNREFDADINDFKSVLKVRGADNGLFHTINITTDQFATGNDRIVNFKSYHFMVVAYAYNGDPVNKNDKYLEGRVTASGTGIPHKPQVENGGTLLTSAYGTAAGITRIFGTGNGGNVLEIMPEDEQEIVRANHKQKITYKGGNAPFAVKVYDPKKVVGGDFTVKLSSRLVYKKSTASGKLNLNDTILATGNFNRPDAYDATNFPNTVSYPQVPGRAIVRRIVGVEPLRDSTAAAGDSLVTLDIEMLNDHLNGRFTVEINENKLTGTAPNQTVVFFGYKTETRPFRSLNSNFTAVAYEYVQNDLWKIKKPNTDWVYADKPVSIFNEQLVPEYGVSIEFKHATNPGYLVNANSLNGYQGSSITFSAAPRWLEGVMNGSTAGMRPWLLNKKTNTTSSDLDGIDPNYVYLNVLNGTWAPYGATATLPFGPAYSGASASNRKISDLQNVDIVYTSDKSKWTRVVVLQGNSGLSSAFELTKKGSTAKSVDVNGNEDPNAPSPTGMGWFPGYAVDLDRGIRLNMMFSEFATQDGKGSDLIWDPTSDEDGGRNFVYVMTTRYDEGAQLARDFDQTITRFPNQAAQFQAATQNLIFTNAMWVGYPRLAKGATKLASDVRVKLRVNRYFTSYTTDENYNVTNDNKPTAYKGNFNPEYTFSTNSLVPQVEQTSIAKSGLDLIRVVPNPYYAYSQYEQRQLDNTVKITNLPRKCKIAIYTVNGTLVRTYNKDDSKTFLDWNLKNDNNLPIASGVYIIHVDAGNIGSKVVKWFGIMRPIDLESF
ncbi:T9SS type A sorting domain-containing protein [Adhaeribacter sp. BT258]|uniref:T9SS type A sorting domain-containing protein n=1 Tax=Adhaeribacter terrigena TaxID=2793070 RepID=A0ABS1C078_9BACT|nr:T9SS type A sorting domain-containing protein [Adhaeribacter terrigena]MBK0402577.1 T9SS type A sorting domain-containing protein [Adhaeribacter terrigena]